MQLTMVGDNHVCAMVVDITITCLRIVQTSTHAHGVNMHLSSILWSQKETPNKGKILNFCNTNGRYWKWIKEGKTSTESNSIAKITSTNNATNELVQEPSEMFETMYRLIYGKDVEITITTRNGKASLE